MGNASRRVRVTCPHNCYDTCAQIATVTDGVVTRLEGDPEHPYTQGRLCAKGYSYLSRLYSEERIRHPMVQEPRGSGRWKRVSWNEALDRIARTLIELQERYQSLLPVCLYKASGNLGVLHQAPEAFFSSMGPITEAVRTLCWTAGYDAQSYDFGGLRCSDPFDMLNARTLLLWGTNPAWTAPHQMRLIMQAREQGCYVVTIDPIVTATASRSDLHLPIRSGTDGALALGMARHLMEVGLIDEAFLEDHALGWGAFREYLLHTVTVEWAATETGIDPQTIRAVAERYGGSGPSMIWAGYGLQRYQNGGQSVRAIDALAAVTGQIGKRGTGVQYAEAETFAAFRGMMQSPIQRQGPASPANRRVSMGDMPDRLSLLDDPPVRLLWVASANPMAQGPNRAGLRSALRHLDMVVVVDQFMTQTAVEADILLPTTTYLEHDDLNLSAWHPYISLNERAIPPLFEARSDLVIAQGLSQRLNLLRPGFCPFPSGGSERDWLDKVWGPKARALFGASSWTALRAGARKAELPAVAWEGLTFATPSGRYELWSERASENGLPPLPVYRPPSTPPEGFPFRLLTPHPAESLNSQFHSSDWGLRPSQNPFAEVHPSAADQVGCAEGQRVRVWNRRGSITLPVRLTRTIPADAVVIYPGTYGGLDFSVNELTDMVPADMGGLTALPGVAFSETFVALEPDADGGERR